MEGWLSPVTGTKIKGYEMKNVKLKLKEIDLLKGSEHEHPDIDISKLYLCKVYNKYAIGYFNRQWYGLSFNGFFSAGKQFDAPGYNNSNWEQVWEVIETKKWKKTQNKWIYIFAGIFWFILFAVLSQVLLQWQVLYFNWGYYEKIYIFIYYYGTDQDVLVDIMTADEIRIHVKNNKLSEYDYCIVDGNILKDFNNKTFDLKNLEWVSTEKT